MSGSKRQSGYRKGVTKGYDEIPELTADDRIAQVVANKGANIFEIKLPDNETNLLAVLPNKFKNLIWIKRNDYIIVTLSSTTAEGTSSATAKSSSSASSTTTTADRIISCDIKFILSKELIKHFKTSGQWPVQFAAAGDDDKAQRAYDDVGMPTELPTADEYEEDEEIGEK
jgi:probable RNA-binding protein EIF1AD